MPKYAATISGETVNMGRPQVHWRSLTMMLADAIGADRDEEWMCRTLTCSHSREDSSRAL